MNFKEAAVSKVNGTHLQGVIDVSYDQLVATFGQPNGTGDGYKVECSWHLEFADGTIATIYNYKTGKKYAGPYGQLVELIRDWHIGGHNNLAVARVQGALAQEFAYSGA